MIAVINNNSYILNSYYTETSGRLHLFINCEDNSYNINTIEEDILNNEGIDLYEDGEVPFASLSGYTKLIHLEKKYNEGTQIYLIVDVESVSELLENMQEDVSAAKTKLSELEPMLNNLITQVNQLNLNLQSTISSLNSQQETVQGDSYRIELLETAMQDIDEQNLATRVSILEQTILEKSETPEQEEQENPVE